MGEASKKPLCHVCRHRHWQHEDHIWPDDDAPDIARDPEDTSGSASPRADASLASPLALSGDRGGETEKGAAAARSAAAPEGDGPLPDEREAAAALFGAKDAGELARALAAYRKHRARSAKAKRARTHTS